MGQKGRGRRRSRTERVTSVDCACGGRLTSVVDSLEAKATAVRYHAATEMHRLWVAQGRPEVYRVDRLRRIVVVEEPPREAIYEGRLP